MFLKYLGLRLLLLFLNLLRSLSLEIEVEIRYFSHFYHYWSIQLQDTPVDHLSTNVNDENIVFS